MAGSKPSKDIGWFDSMQNWNYVKLVPFILHISTVFTDATFFLFPILFQLKCILLPLTTLTLSLLLCILMCMTITCVYCFQHLFSFSCLSNYKEPRPAKPWKMFQEEVTSWQTTCSTFGRYYTVSPGLSYVWSSNGLSQLFLSFYLPYFTSDDFILRAM